MHVYRLRLLCLHAQSTCADPESFVRGGPTLTTFLEGGGGGGRGKDPNTTLGGPASFKWRFAGVLMLGQQRKLAW